MRDDHIREDNIMNWPKIRTNVESIDSQSKIKFNVIIKHAKAKIKSHQIK